MNWIARIWNVAFALFLFGLLLRDGWGGRSLGKLVMGLELRREGERRTGPGTSVVRNVTLIIPVLNLVEIGFLLFAEGGRRIGDRLARTMVVEE